MAGAMHARVANPQDGLFERVMAGADCTDLFHPAATRRLWFGEHIAEGETGPSEFVEMARTMRKSAGPIEYWNRVQYFGDGVFAETHTACFVDAERNHERVLGRSLEVLCVPPGLLLLATTTTPALSRSCCCAGRCARSTRRV